MTTRIYIPSGERMSVDCQRDEPLINIYAGDVSVSINLEEASHRWQLRAALDQADKLAVVEA